MSRTSFEALGNSIDVKKLVSDSVSNENVNQKTIRDEWQMDLIELCENLEFNQLVEKDSGINRQKINRIQSILIPIMKLFLKRYNPENILSDVKCPVKFTNINPFNLFQQLNFKKIQLLANFSIIKFHSCRY